MKIEALYKKCGMDNRAKSLQRKHKTDSCKNHNCLRGIEGSEQRIFEGVSSSADMPSGCMMFCRPPTHAVAALNKILTLGADLSEITFELSALAILSAIYFFIGVWMFKRFHLR